MFTFGWFSSGLDQAAIDLFTFALDHMKSGFMKGRLAYVFCDQAPGETPVSDRFHAAVRERGMPLVTHSSAALRRLIREGEPGVESAREAFDAQVMELLKKYAAELVVLVGYRLIISPSIVPRLFVPEPSPGSARRPHRDLAGSDLASHGRRRPRGRGHDASRHPGVGRRPPGDLLSLSPHRSGLCSPLGTVPSEETGPEPIGISRPGKGDLNPYLRRAPGPQ
jgi:hypothetical protein